MIEAADDLISQAESLIREANTLHQANRNSEAIDKYLEAIDILKPSRAPDAIRPLLPALRVLAGIYVDQTNYPEAIKMLELCIEKIIMLDDEQLHVTLARTRATIGFLLQKNSEYGKSIDVLKSALADCHRIYGETSNIISAKILNYLGIAYVVKQDFASALDCFNTALKMSEDLSGATPNEISTLALNNIGVCHLKLGSPDKAEPVLYASYVMRTELYSGALSAEVPEAMVNLAICYDALEHFEESSRFYHAALDYYRNLSLTDYSPLIFLYTQFAQSALTQRDYENAFIRYEKAIEILRTYPVSLIANQAAPILNTMGYIAIHMCQMQKALDSFQKLNELYSILYRDTDHEDYANSFISVGNCYYNIAKFAKANDNYNLGIEMLQRISTPKAREMLEVALCNMGNLALTTGQPYRALEFFYRAHSILSTTSTPTYIESRVRRNLGLAQIECGYFQSALANLHESQSLLDADIETIDSIERHNNSLIVRYLSARVYQYMGRYEEALASYTHAIDGFITSLAGPISIFCADAYHHRGTLFYELNRNEEAYADFRQSLSTRTKICKTRIHPDIALDLMNMAFYQLSIGNNQRAFRMTCEAFNTISATLGRGTNIVVARAQYLLSIIKERIEHPRFSLISQQEAYRLFSEVHSDNPHPDIIMTLTAQARLHKSLGETSESVAMLLQAIEMQRRLFDETPHPITYELFKEYGLTLVTTKERDLARTYLTRAIEMHHHLNGIEIQPELLLRRTMEELVRTDTKCCIIC